MPFASPPRPRIEDAHRDLPHASSGADVGKRVDRYEAFCSHEVLETGEVGTGPSEYSVMPVWPRWKA